jgi:hypothetical protein
MVRRSLAPIRAKLRSRLSATSRFRLAGPGSVVAATLAVLLAIPVVARAETVMVVGVIVNDKQERVGGALVRLYTTSTKTGRPLAEDRSSTRGIFSLYRTNISGDFGDLYVVYEGETGTAEPIRVSLKSTDGGRREFRTADMVLLTVTAERSLSNDEAATRIAAFSQTQAILVQAGARDTRTASEAVQRRTREVAAAAPGLTGREATEAVQRKTNDKLKIMPFEFKVVSPGSGSPKDIRVVMEPRKDPSKGVS